MGTSKTGALTAREIREALHPDSLGRNKAGHWVARFTFFYRHGRTAQTERDAVQRALGARVQILDCGEHFASFSGGSSPRNSAHFWVEFTDAEQEPEDPSLDIERPDGTTPREQPEPAPVAGRGLVDLILVRQILAQRDRCTYAPTAREAITLALGTLMAEGPMHAEAALRDAEGYAQGCEAECRPEQLCHKCEGGEATVQVAELLEEAATEGDAGANAADLAEHASKLLARCAALTQGDLCETFNGLQWRCNAAMQRLNACDAQGAKGGAA